jgi:branched-chain amino acid transport system permease protein
VSDVIEDERRSAGLYPTLRRASRSFGRLTAPPLGRVGLWAVGLVVLWAVLAKVLGHGAPAGIMIQGLVLGAINSLVALSIVLIYRANRVINFAAADFGAVAAVMAIELHLKLGWNYFLSVGGGIVLSIIIGAFVEVAVLRRFTNAPRMIVGVVTLGVAEILNAGSLIIPVIWSNGNNQGSFNTPFTFQFRLFPVLFNGNYVVAMVVVPVVMLLLVGFLRYTNYGIAIRAAADNGDRARLLGIPVKRLSTIVWMMAAVMSTLAALLRVPIQGFASFSSVSSSGPTLLLATLTAAVIAGLTSMPVAVLASMGLGIVDALGAWTFQNAAYVYLSELIILLAVLMLRRERLTRAVDAGISTWQAIKQVRPIPPELANRLPVRLSSSGLRLGILAFALCIPLFETPAHTHLAAIVLLYSIVAVSLVILTAWAGHISLGHIAFMGLGAAVAGTLIANHGLNPFLAVACAMAATSVVAILLGIPALRFGSGPYLAVVTLALAVTANGYFFLPQYFGWLIPTTLIPQMPLFGRLSISGDSELYYMCLVALVLSLVAVRSLRNSHAGRAMIASNDNRLATQSFALNTVRIQLMAFAISGALAGLAGGLYCILEAGFNAGDFDTQDGINFFLMVVIGGLGSIPGAVLGAVYVYGVKYLLPANYGILATGVGVVVILMFIPGGLGEVVFRVRDGLLRAYANRLGLYVPSLLADRRISEEVAAATPGAGDIHMGDAAAVASSASQPLAIDPQALAERETAGVAR